MRDVWRLVGSIVPSLAIVSLIGIWVHALRPEMTRETFTIMVVSLQWLVSAIVHAAWTHLAFGWWRGEELRAFAEATTAATPQERLIERIMLTDAVSTTVAAAVAGLVAVAALVLVPEFRGDPIVVASAFALITGSWLLLVSGFAVTYLRSWALEDGIVIPGGGPERYTDFVYVSIQVATTFATSDAETRTAGARNWVSLNSVLAFFFNTVVIALFLSVATSAA